MNFNVKISFSLIKITFHYVVKEMLMVIIFIKVEKSLITAIVSSTINIKLALAPFCIGFTLLIHEFES